MKRNGSNVSVAGRVLGLALATTLVGGVGINAASANKVKSAAAPAPMPYVANTPVTSTSGCAAVAAAGQAPTFAQDAYSLYNQVRDIGADIYYRHGYFGQGVDVAVIDTGVAPVKGIDGGNVVDGPDLSFESQATNGDKKNADLPHNDTFGHGTHMAGIIAGRDDANGSSAYGREPYSWGDATKYTGVAPGARVVSLKVADSVGAVDVTQVVAAIDWAVQHRNDYGLHIRVLNISYGIDSHDAAISNVLAHAVRQAWYAGIVVVAAAGNSGHGDRIRNAQGLLSPAYDPRIIAVGAYDNNGTPGYPNDDRSADFSSADTRRHPDILAPGAHVMSLHVPGSGADTMIADDCGDAVGTDHGGDYSSPVFGTDGRFVRGSGTSQAAAVVSGVVALMLSDNPSLTPDQVKDLLKSTAQRGSPDKKSVRGHGEVNLDGYGGAYYRLPKADASQATDPTKGDGELNNARWKDALPCMSSDSMEENRGDYKRAGGARKWTGGICSDVANLGLREQNASYERDVHGQPYVAAMHACDEEINPVTHDYYPASRPCSHHDAAGHVRTRPWTSTIAGEMWNGTVWTGTGFAATVDVKLGRRYWNTMPWQGKDWLGRAWRDHDWTGRAWVGRGWVGRGWVESSWLGRAWTGRGWRDHNWADSNWS